MTCFEGRHCPDQGFIPDLVFAGPAAVAEFSLIVLVHHRPQPHLLAPHLPRPALGHGATLITTLSRMMPKCIRLGSR